MLFDEKEFDRLAAEGCAHYAKSSPVVCDWIDGLYIRAQEQPENVTLAEILTLQALAADGWEHPNHAQNRVYKLLERTESARGIVSF